MQRATATTVTIQKDASRLPITAHTEIDFPMHSESAKIVILQGTTKRAAKKRKRANKSLKVFRSCS